MVLCCYLNTSLAVDIKQEQNQSTIKNNGVDENKKHETEPQPDKELLLFLSEFSDAQGDWIDPEVFNQSYTETTSSSIELEETKNEDLPNNL